MHSLAINNALIQWPANGNSGQITLSRTAMAGAAILSNVQRCGREGRRVLVFSCKDPENEVSLIHIP